MIVDNMQTLHEAEHVQERDEFEVSMHAETVRVLELPAALRQELAA